jgi:outer membrane murein-binding lipoprotein Lpp
MGGLYEAVRKAVKPDAYRRDLSPPAWQPRSARDILCEVIRWVPPLGRGLMSTAGKVLVVLVMTAMVVWIVLTAGVDQLNRNGNEVLHKLVQDTEKLGADLQQTRNDIRKLRDETSLWQERADRQLSMLDAKETEVEKAHSEIQESLSRAQYELAIVQDTIKGAQTSISNRIVERDAEKKAVADLSSEVQTLKTETAQLMDRLKTLRDQFKTTYHANLGMLSKK